MELIGFRSSSPAALILQYVQRQGQATIKDLEQMLGVSTTAVREHLAHLQADGLLATSTLRQGPGRPRLVYRLTAKAQHHFPKQYDLLMRLLLQELAAENGAHHVDRILERVGARLAREYQNVIQGQDIPQRLAELRQQLEERGIPAEVAPANAGLTILACPYLDVAQAHSEVCAMERRMLARVLDTEITLEQSIREGHHQCRFAVQPPQRDEAKVPPPAPETTEEA